MQFKNREGTSLIEAAVSVALIGIMLLWAGNLYSNSLKNTNTTSNIEIAAQLASKQIEYLKTLDENNLDNITTSTSITQFSQPYDKFGYKYIVPQTTPDGEQNPTEQNGEYVKYIEVDIYLMSDTSKPIIRMECNFLRKEDDGTNIGV